MDGPNFEIERIYSMADQCGPKQQRDNRQRYDRLVRLVVGRTTRRPLIAVQLAPRKHQQEIVAEACEEVLEEV